MAGQTNTNFRYFFIDEQECNALNFESKINKIRQIITELEQWNANIAFAQVNLSPLADHKRGNWLFSGYTVNKSYGI